MGSGEGSVRREDRVDLSGPAGHMRVGVDGADRMAELERENSRLQLLVAELLIKNQQLRKGGSLDVGA